MTESERHAEAIRLVHEFGDQPVRLRAEIEAALTRASNDTYREWKNSCAMNGACYLAGLLYGKKR